MFTAGLVQVLLSYPLAVVERAMDPVTGIPGIVERYDLTLARIRKHMDQWAAERAAELARIGRENAPRITKVEPTAEEKQRVNEGFAKLKLNLMAASGRP